MFLLLYFVNSYVLADYIEKYKIGNQIGPMQIILFYNDCKERFLFIPGFPKLIYENAPLAGL